MSTSSSVELPGLNCGVCGFRTCDEMAGRLDAQPDLLKRCIHLSGNSLRAESRAPAAVPTPCAGAATEACGTCAQSRREVVSSTPWVDSLGREFDFYLEHFREDPGPREIIIPHNPMITRELEVAVGDILIGRPLGMSCGCPITHCGIVVDVDQRTGVMTWCVTGPLGPRAHGYKDLGYYIAEGYEGLVTETRSELRIGARYYFQPRMCMLQWRHSGLINYLNRISEGYQIRLEGLFIG